MLLKRVFDLVFSSLMIIVLSPALVVIAIWIRLDSPGPAIYAQRRIGRYGQLFTIYKFRSMATNTPELPTDKLAGAADRYITKVGAFLRKTSLDELPQLFNIFVGDMSFVGPRPALHNQAELIQLREERGVHAIRPGLTGWAQVHGRDEVDDFEKAELDAYYVGHQTLFLDLKILLDTVGAVARARGITH